jgi:hypothetical protein
MIVGDSFTDDDARARAQACQHAAECDAAPKPVSGRSSRERRSLTIASMERVRHGDKRSSLRGVRAIAGSRANGGRCKDHEARNIEGADYAVRPFDVLRSLIELYHSSVRYHSLSG